MARFIDSIGPPADTAIDIATVLECLAGDAPAG